MARIRLENITKKFGTHTAVGNLDLDVGDGEFFVLLGPTGAGKTTTLRMIAGLEKPTEGAIHINQANVNDWGPAERDVALVLQQYSLYPRLTVRDNLAFPLRSRVRKMSEADITKRIDKFILRYVIDAAHYRNVCTIDSYECGYPLENLEPGRYKFSIRIRNPNLRPGFYSLNVAVVSKDFGLHLFLAHKVASIVVQSPDDRLFYSDPTAIFQLDAAFHSEKEDV